MGGWKTVAQRQLWAGEDNVSSGAGVLPVAEGSGKVLLNFRSSEVNEPHTFSVWGGYTDEDDRDPEQTALREFEEESGFKGSIDLVDSSTLESDDFIYVTFVGLVDDEFTPELSWESDGFRWVTYSELVSLKFELHPKFRIFVEENRDMLQEYIGTD